MRASILRVTGSVASVASCLVLVGGVASADTIRGSGRDSDNHITRTNRCESKVSNDTDVRITNNNPQTAESGGAWVRDNDDVDRVTSGDASNTSRTSFNVTVDNSGGGGCVAEKKVTAPGNGNGGGGQGGGGGGGVTPGVGAVAPVGGQGAGGGEVLGEQVAAVPVGGVGAGGGGQEYLSGLVAITLLSGALGVRRLLGALQVQREV